MLVKDKINKNFCIATIILKKIKKRGIFFTVFFTVGRLGERLGGCTEIAISITCKQQLNNQNTKRLNDQN